MHPFQKRALSTREGARLQGFSDNHAFCGSRTSTNLQFGNAVSPLFGALLETAILDSNQSLCDC
ncbi:MAG TPA: DNA cytosine methyltransferase [Planctomycetes bacterium]|nr:DNA cytosine methyltransferase [Planctomycetota bacterium]HIL52931.1 DNA cytosine methyltransferase [Planctomycetota bacterium]